MEAMTRTKAMRPWRRKANRRRGQALAETALLTMLLLGVGGAMMHFFPDSFNALQIYMDSFYFTFSMPVP
jgi:hypothetical protein